MMGENGGLISHIRKMTKNPVFAVHCMAHRIHLAINKAYTVYINTIFLKI